MSDQNYYVNELPNSAVGVLRQLSVSQDGVNRFAIQLINSVKNGDVNALELKATFKAMEQIIEIVDKATKKNQLTESDKYNEKTFSIFGCEFTKAPVKTEYDYASSGDAVHDRLEVDAKAAVDKLKERQTFLRALKETMTVVDEISGEVTKITPPIKKVTDGLKTSIK